VVDCERCGEPITTKVLECRSCGWPDFIITRTDSRTTIVPTEPPKGAGIPQDTLVDEDDTCEDMVVTEIMPMPGPFIPTTDKLGQYMVKEVGGVQTVTDLEPVVKFLDAIRGDAGATEYMDLMDALDREQMRMALMELVGEYRSAAQHCKWMYTEAGRQHIAAVVNLEKLAQEQGETIWPELGDVQEK
jgi:hypothetical protein